MFAVAHIQGELGPGGVPCWFCRGSAAAADGLSCPHCEDGRWIPTVDEESGSDLEISSVSAAQMVLLAREKSWTPVEWLDQPADFAHAYAAASVVLSEIDERRDRG